MRRLFIPTALLILLCSVACQKKEETKDIIIPASAPEVKKGTQSMSAIVDSMDVEWLGRTYKILMTRAVDKSLPKASDENGISYYDNVITIKVKRQDCTYVFNKEFRKSDFARYISHSGLEDSGALLGIVFDKVENDRLVFATSIGSPDISSDEFVPLIMTIDRNGNFSVRKDTQLDGAQPASEGGITGDEEA